MTETGNIPTDATLLRNVGPGKLEAPVVLTPDQIHQIAAGTLLNKGTLFPVTRMGLWIRPQRLPTISVPTLT